MTEQQMMEIADNADMIVNGYAFTESQGRMRVLNLNNAGRAAVLKERGVLSDRDISKIKAFIKRNYKEMYLKWSAYSSEGFYEAE